MSEDRRQEIEATFALLNLGSDEERRAFNFAALEDPAGVAQAQPIVVNTSHT
jgi:hypothetical protein